MLNEFFVRNYKNIIMDEEEPLILGGLNIFIGANGCGKSNLFEAIKFLPDCIEYGLQKTVRTYRKGLASLLNKDISTPNKISFKWQFSPITDRSGNAPVEYELDLSIQDYSHFSLEHETMQEIEYKVTGNRKYLDFESGKGVVEYRHNADYSMLFEEMEISEDETALKTLSSPKQYPAIEYIKNKVSQWRFYNANHMSIRNIKDRPSKVDIQRPYYRTCDNFCYMFLLIFLDHLTE
ncbi:MAG: AAA family ATPase [Nitrospirae bacterium]|nr:AAA family ATPase [Nitrospirota bacterium]